MHNWILHKNRSLIFRCTHKDVESFKRWCEGCGLSCQVLGSEPAKNWNPSRCLARGVWWCCSEFGKSRVHAAVGFRFDLSGQKELPTTRNCAQLHPTFWFLSEAIYIHIFIYCIQYLYIHTYILYIYNYIINLSIWHNYKRLLQHLPKILTLHTSFQWWMKPSTLTVPLQLPLQTLDSSTWPPKVVYKGSPLQNEWSLGIWRIWRLENSRL